jgi:O-acetyl-ADP-ribose deacetylase (regulator of RNase III)
LPIKKIFHAVGPRWHGGGKGERGLLKSAYCSCLELAVEHQCDQVAFPAISTGAYGYPMDLAAEDSLAAVREFLLEHGQPKLVRFVLFGEGAFGAFSRALESLAS